MSLADRRCLAAYTPPGADFPPYVNFTQTDPNRVVITVRGKGGGNVTGEIALSMPDFVALLAEAASNVPPREFLGLLTAYRLATDSRKKLKRADPYVDLAKSALEQSERRDRSDPEGGIPGRNA